MKLLTKEIKSKLPALYSQENNPDPTVVVKFFDPTGSWTWYVLEGQEEEYEEYGKTYTFFGFVHGLDDELGYFTLAELERTKVRFGLGIERDLYWTPKPLSQVKAALETGRPL